MDICFSFLFIYLFFPVLGLCCFAQASSSCGKRASHCSGFPCGAQALVCRFSSFGSWAQLNQLSSVACQIFLGWDGTHVLCTGRWIFIHCVTKEVLCLFLIIIKKAVYKIKISAPTSSFNSISKDSVQTSNSCMSFPIHACPTLESLESRLQGPNSLSASFFFFFLLSLGFYLS